MVSVRANELLDAIGEGVSFDLVGTFAEPLPFLVIFDVMGVPDDQRGWLRQQTATLGRAFANQKDPALVGQGNAAVRGLLEFFSGLLAERAAGAGDDLLSVLSAGDFADHEDRLAAPQSGRWSPCPVTGELPRPRQGPALLLVGGRYGPA